MANSSYSAVNNLNETIGSFKSKVDVKIDSVNTSTASIQATTDKIYDSISKFKQDMIQNEQKQLAHENILRIDQVLKEQFGDHEAIRKTVIGVVKDFDINLVRNSTIQEISEELWITSSRYWLSYALMAVTAWINDYKEVGNNALAECVRRDPVKASLFFCLLNLRFGRNEASSLWFFEYLKTLNPAVMQQESAILLQAYLNGLFGTDKELEHNVNHVIKSWITELNAHQDIAGELVRAYQKYIQLLPAAKECHYQTLQDYCDTYENLKQSYANVSKYDKLIAYIDSMNVELEEQTEGNYKGRVDSILLNLISNYDSEELELKNQQAYFNFIIENDGLVDAAEKQFEEYQNVKSESFDIGKQMIQWAVYDDVDQTDIHVKKFGLQNTKEWFKEAVENWAMMLQETLPLDFPLHIDTWSGVSNGEDQVSLVENMRTYYDNNKFQIMYVNTVNIAAIIVVILSLGLVFVTPYSLAATVIALGLLVFRIIKANKEFPQRVNHSVECLNACMMELADFKQFYSENKDKKAKLLSDVEFL
ncbi:hypothetical protein [Hungatella hathewayi]|uniref:Uncharacterized protein n=1 Tax=Hungatella hathewayi WAL-18680 TaxID=742737 RepID=G5IBI3_9FIRM|nr:hypothetical protein [Hungatella hathewayi]EHI61146.1 hypothetical protein HMPREF9473_00761 [ [Hungatella hathewayi WAL-18680]MBS4984239.1 hypothetical protein [Hungatella hathewayi]